MASKKIVVAADGTATASDAVYLDVITTAVSTDTALTGTLGLVQRGLFFVGGMAAQNKRKMGSWNPL